MGLEDDDDEDGEGLGNARYGSYLLVYLLFKSAMVVV